MRFAFRCGIAVLIPLIYLCISYMLWQMAGISPAQKLQQLLVAISWEKAAPWLAICLLILIFVCLTLLQRTSFSKIDNEEICDIIKECNDVTHKDYSEGLKQLITLTAGCMTFSVSLLHNDKSNFLMLAWLYWGLCILCSLSSIFLSVVVSYLLPRKIAKAKKSLKIIKRPSNIPELTCAIYALLSFGLGLLFFMIKV